MSTTSAATEVRTVLSTASLEEAVEAYRVLSDEMQNTDAISWARVPEDLYARFAT